jgi:hypothetical protein
MPSIKLLSEVAACRNFTLKEESPNRIIFELWDNSNWDKIAKGVNKDSLFGNLTTIILLLVASFIILFIVPKPWGVVCFITGLVLITLFVMNRVKLYQKTKLTSAPYAIFDKNTGMATGTKIDFLAFEWIPWQVEIRHIDSLSLKWDDPRFDMAMLEALDSQGSSLFTVFGRSNDLRNNADLLKTWLKVSLQDEIEN